MNIVSEQNPTLLKSKAAFRQAQELIEESYTSKASFLDLDNIPEYQKGAERVFSGRRVARGLYKASNGRLINADLNGAYNILRKAVLNAFADGIERLGVTPIRFTSGKVTL